MEELGLTGFVGLVAPCLRLRTVPAGQCAVQQGEVPHEAVLRCVTGVFEVEMYSDVPGDGWKTKGHLLAGTWVEDMCAAVQEGPGMAKPRTASLVAACDSELLVISLAALAQIPTQERLEAVRMLAIVLRRIKTRDLPELHHLLNARAVREAIEKSGAPPTASRKASESV